MGIYLRGQDLYPAIISREGSLFEAHFVDLPNCRAVAGSAIEAELKAQAALETYSAVAEKMGRRLPPPTEKVVERNNCDRYVAYIKVRRADMLPGARSLQHAA